MWSGVMIVSQRLRIQVVQVEGLLTPPSSSSSDSSPSDSSASMSKRPFSASSSPESSSSSSSSSSSHSSSSDSSFLAGRRPFLRFSFMTALCFFLSFSCLSFYEPRKSVIVSEEIVAELRKRAIMHTTSLKPFSAASATLSLLRGAIFCEFGV